MLLLLCPVGPIDAVELLILLLSIPLILLLIGIKPGGGGIEEEVFIFVLDVMFLNVEKPGGGGGGGGGGGDDGFDCDFPYDKGLELFINLNIYISIDLFSIKQYFLLQIQQRNLDTN